MRDAMWDVIVVGGGIGGLAAGLRAAECGARALVLEAGNEAGGSGRLSSGFVATVRDLDDFLRRNQGGNPKLARALFDTYPTIIAWLEGHGVLLGPLLPNIVHGTLKAHPVREPMPELIGRLVARYVERGGVLHCGERAIAARRLDDGPAHMFELTAATHEGTHGYVGRGVVFATGGFQGDAALAAEHLTPWEAKLVRITNPHSVGDGLRLAQSLGAATTSSMERFYGHLLPVLPGPLDASNYRPYTQLYSPHALLLNQSGERFVDESSTDEHNCWATSQQDEAIAWLVYDSATRREHVVGPPFAGMPDVDKLDVARQAGATIVAAETLQGLARALAEHGLPLERTRHTLEDYQAHCDGTAEGPLGLPKARFQHPLAEAPFFGLQVRPSLYATYGGLRANAAAEVLDDQGQPLPGLYAAGVDLGDVHHCAYAGGLATGLVFGYLAGQRAALRRGQGVPSASR